MHGYSISVVTIITLILCTQSVLVDSLYIPTSVRSMRQLSLIVSVAVNHGKELSSSRKEILYTS